MPREHMEISPYDSEYSISRVNCLNAAPDGATHFACLRIKGRRQFFYIKKVFGLCYRFEDQQWKITVPRAASMESLDSMRQEVESIRQYFRKMESHRICVS